jgi:sugar phosphate isomerase/epimerase
MNPDVTLLSSMASTDFSESLRLHREWGVHFLDLKDAIYGKSLLDLTDDEAARANAEIRAAGLEVYALSSNLFNDEIDKGEAVFREAALGRVERLVQLAQVFRPTWVRLLAARTERRKSIPDIFEHLEREHPWLLPMYAEAVDRIHAAGERAILENEVHGCILRTPDEVLEFFRRVDRPTMLGFTLDIGNLWQEGTYPTLDGVQKLAKITRYLHLKGGQASAGASPGPGCELQWRSALADTTWPVRDVIDAYLANGGSMICINPPHGSKKPDYDYENLSKRDVDFVKGVLLEKTATRAS